MMKKRKLGIIGGSGLYKMDGFEKNKWKKVNTSWGNPSDKILSISEEIIKYGKVKRAWIGSLSFRPFIYTDKDNIPQRALLVISNESETDENGLINGDIITSIKDSEAVWSTLKASINSITPGDSLELGIVRDGQKRSVLIETTEIPARLLVP